MSDFGHWECNIDEVPEDAQGFVYKITEIKTGKFYIGCKLLFRKVTRPPLKGQKRKRRLLKESDWKTYCSSSGVIADVIKENKSDYKFEILSFHDTKTKMKIEEARLIIENIYDEMCYNQIVNLRVRIRK